MSSFNKIILNELQRKINTHKRMLECLELRLYLIDSNKANKTEYERNEDEMIKIITCSKIDSVLDKIFCLEIEFNSLLMEI
jgi:hypothetical protein